MNRYEEKQKELQALLARFLESYHRKPVGMSDGKWLIAELAKELPNKSQEEIRQNAQELTRNLDIFRKERENLTKELARGMSRDEFLHRELQKSCEGFSGVQTAEFLNTVDHALADANEMMLEALLTQKGDVNQNPNLFGFIFEAEHAGQFNMDAAMQGEDVRATVLKPAPGEGYSKNSPDVEIDRNGQRLQNAQMKAGGTPQRSNAYLENGDYEGQTGVVPKGHGRPGHSQEIIVQNGVSSKPVSVDEVKAKQRDAQQRGEFPQKSWDDYELREITYGIGKQAALAGLTSASISCALSAGVKLWNDERIDGEELVMDALTSGSRSAVTTAVAGALKAAMEKGIIIAMPAPSPRPPLPIPQRMPIPRVPFPRSPLSNTAIVGIAIVAVEAICLTYKVATGELKTDEALIEFGTMGVATMGGLILAGEAGAIGATIGSVFGPIGTALGGFVGGTIGYMAGSSIGRKYAEEAVRMYEKTRCAIKKAWEGAKDVGNVIRGTSGQIWSLITN